MLTEHEFIKPDQCARIIEIVHALKEHWVNRAAGFLPFYTLGAASYLDASTDKLTPYYQAAERYNPILESHFPQLYESLKDTLSQTLNIPVTYAKGMSLPGFHIFLANKAFENPIASTHFDLQFKPLKWEYEQVDFAHPISFTCAVSLPHAGTGINYWDISQEEVKDLNRAELEDLKKSKETHFLPYSQGKLVLHRGLILHQIAPCKEIKPTDERITLQGHGLICDGILRLYW